MWVGRRMLRQGQTLDCAGWLIGKSWRLSKRQNTAQENRINERTRAKGYSLKDASREDGGRSGSLESARDETV